jgi:hypothetical protein
MPNGIYHSQRYIGLPNLFWTGRDRFQATVAVKLKPFQPLMETASGNAVVATGQGSIAAMGEVVVDPG